MKTQILTSLVVLLLFFACQEHIVNKPKEKFSEATGEEIPKSDAERWIDRYSKLQSVARIQSSSYNINAEQLDAMLQTDNLIGIAFHHATDDQGDHHVLAIPLDNTPLWNADKYIVDANTNQKVKVEEGEKWARNYSEHNPGAIWYHRFGSDIFDDIKSISYFKSFDIEPAMNDELVPQLVLVIKNQNAELNGRVNSFAGVYYDKSNPCPCQE